MKRLLTGLVTGLALTVAVSAQAAPITGGISFIGDASSTPLGSNWATATGVDFLGCSVCTPGKEAVVENNSGSYAGTGGLLVDFTDFTFFPALVPDPVNPLWTFTNLAGTITYSFIMDDVQVNSQGTGLGGQTFLVLTGIGTLFITGLDPTPGVFAFSGNESGGVFSVSASSFAQQPSVVPEPGTLVLLGIGLLGVAAYARRRRLA